MPRISIDNYDTVASWNGSQDLFVVEQSDGTKVATPEQLKQYVLNDMDNVPTQNSNNPVKSGGIYSKIGDLTQTGLTGDSVAEQLTDAKGQITGKAEKNPSVFSDYTSQGLYAAAQSMTITDLKGGYKVKDGICYVNVQFSFTGSFNTPGAWAMLGGFPISAINGVPFLATPTNNDANSAALLGGRMNNQGLLLIVNIGAITGGNSTAFTFIGSYPVANS